jgi:predicted O-methyltransferase YrrM
VIGFAGKSAMAFVPAVVLGRLRTALDAVIGRRALRRARDDAWQRYAPLQDRLRLSMKMQPSDRIARFARNILDAELPRPVRYLEIGAFEGGSLSFVHTLLDGQARITVIDPFLDYAELPGADWTQTQAILAANLQAIGASEAIRILKGRSVDHLPRLIDAGEAFDLIYIDGSHHMLDVIVDAALAWRLLAPSGLMIFDDYWYQVRHGEHWFRPRPAVDAFIGMIGRELTVVDVGGQVFVRRK